MLDDMSSARVPSVEVSLNPPWPLNTLLSIDLFLAASSSQEQYRVRSADCDMYNVLFQAWQHHRITIVFKALHRRPDALTCVDIEARVPSMMETCHSGEAMSFYARRPQGTATHMPHCRTMSDYVELCHVGLLGSRSKEKIQKWSNLDWKWMLECWWYVANMDDSFELVTCASEDKSDCSGQHSDVS